MALGSWWGTFRRVVGGVMRFSGRLQIEADPHNWLKADLMVARGRVELVTGSDLLGSWSTSQVVAERVEADRFSLQLGEDRALFIADDALSFSYEAIPQLNKRQLIPVGGVMDKLKAGLRGDDPRDPAVIAEPPRPLAAESPVATTGKRLRELIKEASGYATASPAFETTRDPEKKAGHTLDAVLRWRAGAKDDAATEPSGESELSTEDLLERLFDAPDVSEPEPARTSLPEPSVPGPLWAELANVPEPAKATVGAEIPVVMEPPVAAPPVAEPTSEPKVETWQKDQPPLEVWHKTDLSPTPEPQWASSRLTGSPVAGTSGISSWPSTFDDGPSGSPSEDVIAALELIVADVKSGALSTEQVQAVTALIEAITKAVQLKF